MKKNFYCIDCKWHFSEEDIVAHFCPKCGSVRIFKNDKIMMEL